MSSSMGRIIPCILENSYGVRIDLPSKARVRDSAGNSPPRCHELHAQAEATNSDYSIYKLG